MKTVSAITIAALILAPAVWSQTQSPSTERFEQFDTNGDGRLSPAEVGAPRLFKVADTDGDGFISPAEFEAASRNRENLPAGRPVPPRAAFTETSHTLTVDGRERSYVLQAPKSPRGPLPVVFFFHGGGGRGENMAAFGYRELTAKENFLAVYPTGWKNNWNDGRNAARIAAQQEGVDDVKLVRAIVDDLAARYEIDRSRVFATGASNGGIFSHYLAAKAADLFAAIAPVIGGLAEPVAPDFQPSHPISLMVIQGDADQLVPINGGAISNQDRGGRIIATEAMLQLYRRHNGITGEPEEALLPDTDPDDGCRALVRRYPPGKDGVKVEYWLIQGGGHTMPGRRRVLVGGLEAYLGKTCRDFDGLEAIWEFFKTCPPRSAAGGNK
jgi:polyhydroxybutyrate depolymerase